MSGSGLIYAAIAILWAAVLIPMWLRNHDTAAENRSAERFGQAMRVLSRKEREDADVARQTPADQVTRQESAELPAPARPAQRATQRRVHQPMERPARRPARRRVQRPAKGQRTLAQRRARTLGVMVGLTLLITLVAAVSPVPWWAPLPVVALLGAFVVHLRIQALQRQRRPGRVRRSAERPVATESVVDASVERPTSGFVSGPSKAVTVETKGVGSSDEVTVEQDAEQDGDETWRPNPLPLPTYVTAPKAVRPIKVIDLTTPGAWSSGRILDDDLADEDLLAAEVADEELDALLAQEAAPRPAAGENGEHDEHGRRAVGD